MNSLLSLLKIDVEIMYSMCSLADRVIFENRRTHLTLLTERQPAVAVAEVIFVATAHASTRR